MDIIKLNIGGQTLDVSKDDITKAMEDGNLSIENEEIKVFKQDDYNTLVGNIETEKYNEGKTAGEQMAVKAVRDEYGLEFEGKTVANFATAFKAKIEADSKIEPNAKVKELTTDIEKLRGNLSEWEEKYNGLQTSVAQEKKAYKVNSLVSSSMPTEGLSIKKDMATSLFNMNHEIDFDEAGTAVIKKDGVILKNETTRSPMALNDVVNTFLKDNGLITAPSGGAGGGDASVF